MPSPPASQTCATRSGPAMRFMPDCTMGTSIPRRSQSRVRRVMAQSITAAVLEVRGVKLEAEWHGPREGPVLVFLHEGLGSVGLWRGFPEKLAKATGRVAYLRGPLRERLARWHEDVDSAFWGWNGPWLDPDFRRWNIESSLPQIRAPLLVVQGENDEYGTIAQVEAIRRGAAGPVEVQLLKDCGHSPHRDQEEATLRTMSDFLARHCKKRESAE